uniref:Uncharacterized protein n=1 Tax=Anguilla anguilla TaxID=7936 RepID=A0A0E9R057_ANGAN
MFGLYWVNLVLEQMASL